jgi:enamine deaminase RidA (YjgF/YER057c/UK114 family)
VVTPSLLVQGRNKFFAHAGIHDCGIAARHGTAQGWGGTMIERQQIFPEGMPKRIVNGHLLYTPVVTVVPGKLVFVSGILARNNKGEIVGKGDMAAQIGQVYENIRTALAAAGATMANIVKRQTFTTDIDAYFANIDARMAHGGDHNSTSTTVEVRRLSHPDFLIEVEVMAVIPE